MASGVTPAKDAYTPLQTNPDQDRQARSTRLPVGESEDTKDIEDDGTTEIEIPKDAYGATVLALVLNLQHVMEGENLRLNLTAVLFSIGTNVLNLILQFGLVYFIQNDVVEQKVYGVQAAYKNFHGSVFNANGEFNRTRWEAYDVHAKTSLCEIAMTNKEFYFCILFVWVLSMLRELRSTWKLGWNIQRVPHVSSSRGMLRRKASEEGSGYEIVGLTGSIRLGLHILVTGPKMLICLALLFLGCVWLSATARFEDLVMNAVAMQFVTEIDELLYQVMIPKRYQRLVEEVHLVLPADESTADKNIVLWRGYWHSTVYFIVAVAFVFVYANFLQNVLPSDLSDVNQPDRCPEFLKAITGQTEPICSASLLDQIRSVLRSGSVTSTCYPYGRIKGDQLAMVQQLDGND